MAEIVEYRLEKSLDEIDLLVEFGLLEKEHGKEILAKRENYEYCLRRRTRSKLDYLKYIKFEINLLDSIEKYRSTVLKKLSKSKTKDSLDELDHRILLLQAKKLRDVVISRCAHISSLFRKLTNNFQFDTKLWLAYIEFAKSRRWYSKTTAIYWRLLRVASDNQDIWLEAAEHELETNKAFDVARGLYLRALRHHPKSARVYAEYFKMELKFMEVVDRRARIVLRMAERKRKEEEKEEEKEDEDIWAEKDEIELKEQSMSAEEEVELKTQEEKLPEAKPIDEDDAIISGHLPKVIYDNATAALNETNEYQKFIMIIMKHILALDSQTKGAIDVKEYILEDLKAKVETEDSRVSKEMLTACYSLEKLESFVQTRDSDQNYEQQQQRKKLKEANISKMNLLYKCYDTNGLEKTRELFDELEKSVKNQTLSLYVGMIQVESWQLMKDKSLIQLNRIRSLYDKALVKFGKSKAKLWYEYLHIEHDNAQTLDDFERLNQLYLRAQSTLESSKVDRVIEKYTMIQVKKSSADIEYSDYSDLEE